ncbi:hypothetical protein HYH03_003290 [Edaphochlamys debaryana]|uniref:Uncharacterized protein n=1 Tax=Edaphochlamys debaryana TaxID=47281 RepID=A0A835YB94_9CHLO|nr:hypothetical protein HYH03_003290 [Edaphochlamys debaryana]|eukprot:KAG2498539.1 hypothetical protein HYH03_003290 [Edaphochlamys debaryana]
MACACAPAEAAAPAECPDHSLEDSGSGSVEAAGECRSGRDSTIERPPQALPPLPGPGGLGPGSSAGGSDGSLLSTSSSGVGTSTSAGTGVGTGVGTNTGASGALSGTGAARAASSPSGARLLPPVSSQAGTHTSSGASGAGTLGPGGPGSPSAPPGPGPGPPSPVGRSSSVTRGTGGDGTAPSKRALMTQRSTRARAPVEPPAAGGRGGDGDRGGSPRGAGGGSGDSGACGGSPSCRLGLPRSYSRRSLDPGPWRSGPAAGPGSGDGPESPTRLLHSPSGLRRGSSGLALVRPPGLGPSTAPPPTAGGPADSISGGCEAQGSPQSASSPLLRSPMLPPGLPSRPSMRRGAAAGSLGGADSPTAAATAGITSPGASAAMGPRFSGAPAALQALRGSPCYRRPRDSSNPDLGGGNPPASASASAPAPASCSSPTRASRVMALLMGPGGSGGGDGGGSGAGGGGEAAHQGSPGRPPPRALSSPLGREPLSVGAVTEGAFIERTNSSLLLPAL